MRVRFPGSRRPLLRGVTNFELNELLRSSSPDPKYGRAIAAQVVDRCRASADFGSNYATFGLGRFSRGSSSFQYQIFASCD